MIYGCNELNIGYAADGFARARGVGAAVVTYTVGGLSLLNAVAGAASERLPFIAIPGGPNSNDWGERVDKGGRGKTGGGNGARPTSHTFL